MALQINSDNFEQVISSDKLVIIDFWATWCGPCRALSPIMDELAEQYKDEVVIAKCDTDENNEIAMQFGVRNIPMLVSSVVLGVGHIGIHLAHAKESNASPGSR